MVSLVEAAMNWAALVCCREIVNAFPSKDEDLKSLRPVLTTAARRQLAGDRKVGEK